ARIIRAQVLTVKERQFIERARAVGSGSGVIIRKHILPNVIALVWAEAVLTISSAVFTEAFLSFFGLGWRGPGAVESWGQIANEAYTNLALLRGLWLYFAPPGIFITLVVLGFAMLGHGLEEVLNPALKRRAYAVLGSRPSSVAQCENHIRTETFQAVRAWFQRTSSSSAQDTTAWSLRTTSLRRDSACSLWSGRIALGARASRTRSRRDSRSVPPPTCRGSSDRRSSKTSSSRSSG